MHHSSTLIIGDIHHRTDIADQAIRHHGKRFSQIVFLGDYFDDFGDSPDLMRQTCRWLVESLARPNRIHLLGNHDIAYLFPQHRQCGCPGHTAEKQRVFDEEMSGITPSQFRLAVNVGSWLLSHAGFHPALADGLSAAEAVARAEDEFGRIQRRQRSRMLGIGAARGGDDAVGGPLWLDWNREFRPVPGLHQIVGHTPAEGVLRGKALTVDGAHRQMEIYEPSPIPRTTGLPQPGADWSSVNWCLDTNSVIHGAIIQDAFVPVIPQQRR